MVRQSAMDRLSVCGQRRLEKLLKKVVSFHAKLPFVQATPGSELNDDHIGR